MSFERLLARDRRNEARIFWGELGVLGLIAFLVAVYLILA